MALQAGIVGLPNVGKSTIFNALTAAGAESANYPFCTIEPNTGIVPVPDPRLKLIHSKIATDRVLPATVEIVDIAGLVRGASKGEGLGNQFLGHIRATDAILHVVRCFDDGDIIHVEGSIDPLRDIETIDFELVMADAESVDKRLKRYAKPAKSGDKDAIEQYALAEKMKLVLEEGVPLRRGEWTEDEWELVQGAQMITSKPVMYVCNVDEDGINGDSEFVKIVTDHAAGEGSGIVLICAQVESEISEMDRDDQAEFLADLGLSEPGLARLARETYNLLGMETYFTAGVQEIRAWTYRKGWKAPKCAGVIHGDFERGFIRAEVYKIPDLLEYNTEAGLKAAGKLRVEGKEYVVQDGDVMHFRFNV